MDQLWVLRELNRVASYLILEQLALTARLLGMLLNPRLFLNSPMPPIRITPLTPISDKQVLLAGSHAKR